MKIIISNSIVQGIFIAVAAGAIMFFAKYLVRVICPIRKSKVFSSFKYDEQMLEDGTYVLEENKEYKEFFCGTVAHCIYRNISSHNIAVNRRLQNATSRINTAFFVTKKEITPHWIWYNRVAKKL